MSPVRSVTHVSGSYQGGAPPRAPPPFPTLPLPGALPGGRNPARPSLRPELTAAGVNAYAPAPSPIPAQQHHRLVIELRLAGRETRRGAVQGIHDLLERPVAELG